MLIQILKDKLKSNKFISVHAFMTLALQHPEYGYYTRKPAIGKTADFITAPEISQCFGEILGLWCAQQWQDLGSPSSFSLVEYGPGKGTLLQDILRIIAHIPAMHNAMQLHLVESNHFLRKQQQSTLKIEHTHWHNDASALPALPSIHIGNEFLDVFPIEQYQKINNSWYQRGITLDIHDALCLTHRPSPHAHAWPTTGAWYETSPNCEVFLHEIRNHIEAHAGAACFIDYGYETGYKDTLQALKNHHHVDPLAYPGESDLTAHVDFSACKKALTPLQADCQSQATFLQEWGILLRLEQLCQQKDIRTICDLKQGVERLIGEAHMGQLFKALTIRAKPLDKAAHS